MMSVLPHERGNGFFDVRECNAVQGKSGVSQIDSFSVEGYSTRFAGEIKGFQCNGYVTKKNERRMDNCIKYTMVAGKKVAMPICPQEAPLGWCSHRIETAKPPQSDLIATDFRCCGYCNACMASMEMYSRHLAFLCMHI